MRLLILLLALFGPKFFYAKVTIHATEHYCIVREPKFSETFDFTELSSDNDYVIRHDRDVALRLQMCKPLKQKCNNEDGYSVCLTRHGQQFGIGKEPPEVEKEFGKIKFIYTGDECDKSHKYAINITMICDYGVKDGSGMRLFATGYNDCDFDLEWRSKYACTEKKQMKCNVDDKTGHYDLSSLTDLSNNYEVYINDTYSIILNICHSILYGPNTCKASSAACLVDRTSNNRISGPLGEPVDNLRYNPEDKSLSLTYMDGKPCNRRDGKDSHFKTTITFFCDLSATGTLPEYVGGMENCHLHLTWKTAAACSEEQLHAKSLEKLNFDVCTAKDPLSGEIYNLRPLMGKEFSVKYLGIVNDIYKFSICSPLSNTTCKTGSGACRYHKNTSGGMVNPQLMWKESGFYLNYTNGDLCLKKIQRYTIIEFYCGKKEDFEIDEETDLCYDVIKMSTNLVCSKKKKSCATYGNEMNFERLTRENTTYSVKSDDSSEYHINVCRSIKNNLNCDGAAICKSKIINGKMTTVNLGYYVESPILTTDQSAVLIYKNGSICEEDKKKKIESSISFLCDINANEGHPVMKNYSSCTYFFEWKTSIACGKVEGFLNKNCTLTNDLGDHRNLSVLSGPGSLLHHIGKFNEEHTNYKISFCNQFNQCNGTFICDDKKNYGTEVSVLFDYTDDLIEMKFTKGSKCSDGSFGESTFIMICKEGYFINSPDLLYEDECQVGFEWRTSLICKSGQTIVPYSLDEVAGEKLTSSLSGGEIAIIVIFTLLLLFAIGYFQNASRRTHFIDMITNSTTRNRDRVRYSRVNTMEEVHLLVNASDPTAIDSDSDDDLLEA